MSTTMAAQLRSKMFGGGGSSSGLAMAAAGGSHTTEALRQATDRLLKEQSSAEVAVSIYRQKLSEAQEAVKRVEKAYVEQNQMNARLQGWACSAWGRLTLWQPPLASADPGPAAA